MLNKIKKYITCRIDVWLLLAMLLILNVSTTFKLAGLLVLFLYKPTILKSIKLKNFPIFYLIMIGIIIIQTAISLFDFHPTILKINLISSIIWGVSLFALIQINRIVSDTDFKKIQNTVVALFLTNAFFSGFKMIEIMFEIDSINPYTYDGLVLNPLTGISMYGGATGDYIGGVFGTHSLHNAFFNLFGVVYFLLNRKYLISIICLAVLLMTTSNLAVLILFSILGSILLFHRIKAVKYVILLFLLVIATFYTKVSPNNFEYAQKMLQTSEKGDTDNPILKKIKAKNEEEIKNQKIAKYIAYRIANDKTISKPPKPNVKNNQPKKTTKEPKKSQESAKSLNDIVIADNKEVLVEELGKNAKDLDSVLERFGIPENSTNKEYDEIIIHNNQNKTDALTANKLNQFKTDLHAYHTNLKNKVMDTYKDSINLIPPPNLQKYPGKVISYIETLQYLTSSVTHFIIGSGAGQFSSKVAFGISGFSVGEGGEKRTLNKQVDYISNDFKENHLKLFSYYWLKDPGEHSISTEPFSAYNQIAGEYGILGIIAFVVGYLLFFFKRFRQFTAGKYLLIMMLLMLLTDYWFEHLNVIIIFELLMFLDLKKKYEQ
ncbi:MAG TPA: hypothetical protein PLP27_08910 [Crocinitomicaceae bacterium]|nr:hypothetical protein [Crocinitomicaceae bacterium]